MPLNRSDAEACAYVGVEPSKLKEAKKKDAAARSETERLMLEAEGGALDFSDEADLAPIVHAARFDREADA